MNNVNLWIDTIKENHFEPRNAKWFSKYCNKVAIHYGWNGVKESWAKEIGLSNENIAHFTMNGQPEWLPNVVLVDKGRNLAGDGAIKLEKLKNCVKICYTADEHRHFYSQKVGIDKVYREDAKRYDYVFVRQHCAMSQHNSETTFWFPHCVQSESLPDSLEEPKHDIVFISSSINEARQKMIDALHGFDVKIETGN